jgi:predicted transcriptional regulator of viral defense system
VDTFTTLSGIPALSARETAVLAWADRTRRTRLTTRDVAGVVGQSPALKTASSLVRKGVLDRVGRGVYLVRPLRAIAGAWTVSALAAVAALLQGQTHYVGGPAALALHRLTTQAYGSVLDVFVTGHRRPRTLGGARVVFHVAPPAAFAFGLTTARIESADVVMSDPARTIIDMVEHPDLLGTAATFEAVRTAAPRLNLPMLLDYAARWPNLSTCQRLGVLLERGGVPVSALAPLVTLVQDAGVAAMLRAAPRRGRVHPTWGIVLNDVDGANDGAARLTNTAVRATVRGPLDCGTEGMP